MSPITKPRGEHVDVIDDNVELRTLLQSVLQAHGYSVAAYESAEAFLTLSADHRTRVILTDMHMAGLSGLELQNLFIQAERKTPFVFMSGGADEQVQERALAQGAVTFLLKPFGLDTLLQAIAQAMALSPPSIGSS